MPAKFNTEFNYRYQVIGETVWEKIKTLRGFLDGRIQAADLEEISNIKYEAKKEKLKYLEENGGLRYEILELKAEILEIESHRKIHDEMFDLNKQEIEILHKVLAECYEIAEPTRIPGYTDEQMFEVNAANEFTAMIGKEIYSEILATGHPSPAKIRNAMSNPMTWNALMKIGLIPNQAKYLEGSPDPLKIELVERLPELPLEPPSIESE